MQAEAKVLQNNNYANFNYNSGSLKVKTTKTLYTSANRDIYVVNGYYMRKSTSGGYDVISLVSGKPMSTLSSNSAVVQVNANNVEENLVITLNQTITSGSMKAYLKGSSKSNAYEVELSCTNAGVCTIASTQVEYAANVNYANE